MRTSEQERRLWRLDKTITLLAGGRPIATALDALVLRAPADEALWRVTLVWLTPCGDTAAGFFPEQTGGGAPLSVEIRDRHIRRRYTCCALIEANTPSKTSGEGGVLYTLLSFLAHAKEEIS